MGIRLGLGTASEVYKAESWRAERRGAARTLSLGMWHPVRSHKDLSPWILITEGPWTRRLSLTHITPPSPILNHSQTLHMDTHNCFLNYFQMTLVFTSSMGGPASLLRVALVLFGQHTVWTMENEMETMETKLHVLIWQCDDDYNNTVINWKDQYQQLKVASFLEPTVKNWALVHHLDDKTCRCVHIIILAETGHKGNFIYSRGDNWQGHWSIVICPGKESYLLYLFHSLFTVSVRSGIWCPSLTAS